VPAIAGIDEDHLMDDRKVGDILPERENAESLANTRRATTESG
jgi:hypothetical protein